MNGKDGKPFKTRDGGVMRLENLIKEIDDAVYEKVMSNRDISEEEAREIAKVVGLAAIKYGDLSNQASKDYVFDLDRFTSFEGNTGPYILYTIVRIKSILTKYKNEIGQLPVGATIKPAFNDSQENAPHKVCQYIYELSNAFSKFYHETKIISEENKEQQDSWITLISLTEAILNQCIDLLGLEAPERM